MNIGFCKKVYPAHSAPPPPHPLPQSGRADLISPFCILTKFPPDSLNNPGMTLRMATTPLYFAVCVRGCLNKQPSWGATSRGKGRSSSKEARVGGGLAEVGEGSCLCLADATIKLGLT